jgi:DNA helicase-2/ATP-dependent DNA helicase PcrA
MGMREGSLPRQSLYRVMNRPERYLLRSVADKEQIPVQRLRDNILRQKGSVTELTEFLKDLFVLSTIDPEGFLRYLFDAMGYGRWAQENLGSAYEVKKVQEELLRLSRQFKDTGEMIEAAVRGREKHRKESSGGVQIMTMHACKGLEFERVYLPALNEGIIPGRRCREAEDLEEERRLLYVAMTRARQHLELLYVTGSRENPRPPSRFLSVYGVKSFVYS